jgi:hypothetical protein
MHLVARSVLDQSAPSSHRVLCYDMVYPRMGSGPEPICLYFLPPTWSSGGDEEEGVIMGGGGIKRREWWLGLIPLSFLSFY